MVLSGTVGGLTRRWWFVVTGDRFALLNEGTSMNVAYISDEMIPQGRGSVKHKPPKP